MHELSVSDTFVHSCTLLVSYMWRFTDVLVHVFYLVLFDLHNPCLHVLY